MTLARTGTEAHFVAERGPGAIRSLCRWPTLAAALVVVCALLPVAGCGPYRSPEGLRGDRGSSALPPGASVAPTLAGVVAPPSEGAYLGIYQPPAPFEISALDGLEALSDKPPAIIMWYQPWAESGPQSFDPAAVVSVYGRHAVPMISWEPWNPGPDAHALEEPANQPTYRLADITAGRFDDYIRAFARSVKAVRGPVMIRLMHEMNGNWYPWAGTVNGNQPSDFIPAWRHVHGIFEAEGATNVTWVWSVNHESVPAVHTNAYGAYYPGDKYVDWVSISGFNWGTTRADTAWRPLDFWYRRPMAYLRTTGKPIVVSEFASVEEGGDKGAWITEAYERFRSKYPGVKAVIYYNKAESQVGGAQDWRIDTSPGSREAYRAAVASPFYLGAPAATLSAWEDSLTQANWVYLRAFKPVY